MLNKAIRSKAVILFPCIAILVYSIFPGFSWSATHGAPQSDDALISAVEKATTEYFGAPPPTGVIVSNVTTIGQWAFGTIGVVAPPIYGAGPEGLLFLAQNTSQGWQVAIEHTPTFQSWVAQAPANLVPKEARPALAGNLPQGDGSAQLSLPWARYETWTLTGGPHSNDGSGARPWSALDFAGGSGEVRAASDGIAYLDCPNLLPHHVWYRTLRSHRLR